MDKARITFAVVVGTGLLCGCAAVPPVPGESQAEVMRAWGTPTARYALADDGLRLEYATGPYGRTTWMVDLDRSGVVVDARQVLNPAEFLAVQSTPELSRGALLMWLGTPGDRHGGGLAGGQVWSWRYPTNDCLWFRASVGDDGLVHGAAYGIDPACDASSERRH